MNPQFAPDFQFRGGLNPEELPADRLDREALARQLAQSLQHQDTQHSVVIGLAGEWGSGKSWLIARVRELLKSDYEKAKTNSFAPEEAKPPTLPYSFEFATWQWSGTEEITTQFFDQLAEAIRTVEEDEAVRGRSGLKKWWLSLGIVKWILERLRKLSAASTSEKLSAYAAWFSAHSSVVGGYNKGFVGLLGVLALLSSAELFHKWDWLSPLSSAIIAALAFVYGLFVLASEVLSKQADARKKWAEANDKKPRALKKELGEKLSHLPHPIIVVLDDLDRLTASEVAHVFQLVKTQADFPNIHYLLGFDRNLIAGALEKEAPGVPGNGLPAKRGHDFLEKIVPVIFDLPLINDDDLRDILCADLDAVFELSFYDNSRWINLWSSSFHFFFGTLRDIDRFHNSLKFNLYLVGGRGDNLNVDALDFAGIETLRLFEPEVFARLSQKRELLTRDRSLERQLQAHSASSNPQASPTPTRDQELLEEICKTAIVSEEGVRLIIRHLFPEVEKMLRRGGEGAITSDYAYPGHAARASQPTFFPRFFRYALGPDEWSGKEVTDFMAKRADPSLFAEMFQQVADGKKSPAQRPKDRAAQAQTEDVRAKGFWHNALNLCDLIGQRTQGFSQTIESTQDEDRQQTALSLLRAGMILPADHYFVTSQHLETRMGQHAHNTLRSIQDFATREALTLKVLDESPDTFAANMALVLNEMGLHQRVATQPDDFSKRFLLLSPSGLQRAQFTVAQQIQAALEDGVAWRRPQARLYLECLELWEDAALKTRKQALLTRMINDGQQCFYLLEAFLDVTEIIPFGANRVYASTTLLLDRMGGAKGLGHFVPIADIESTLPALRLHLIGQISSISNQGVPLTLASSPAFYRKMLCYIGLKNYVGAKQQPPTQTSIETEATDLLEGYRSQNPSS